MHGDGGNLPDRARLPFPEILGSQDHDSFPDRGHHLLIDKLNLVYSGNPGKRGLTVCTEHDIIREIYAERNHLLQNQRNHGNKKSFVKCLLPNHVISFCRLICLSSVRRPG